MIKQHIINHIGALQRCFEMASVVVRQCDPFCVLYHFYRIFLPSVTCPTAIPLRIMGTPSASIPQNQRGSVASGVVSMA